MKRQVAIAVIAAFASLVVAPGTSSADGAAIATEAAKPKPRTPTTLTLKNAATTPGEKKTYEAVLRATTRSDTPVPNKKVTFRIEGKNGTTVPNGGIVIGEGTTDAEGRATVTFATPDLAQGAYALEASFAGDHQMLGDDTEANLFVAKAVVKFDLSDANAFETGSSTLYISAALVRDSDKKAIAKPVTLTVNGKPQKLSNNGSWQLVLQPIDASSWKMKFQFDGDDSTLATTAERTYTRPPKK